MTYLVIGVVTFAAALLLGIHLAAREGNYYGNDMLVMNVIMSFIGSLFAGAAWPATWLIGIIVGGIKWADHRKNTTPPTPPKPPTDSQRYQNMAAEQRALAVQARKDGMDDLAEMQENLAAQYEQAANIYRNARETA